MKLKDTFTFYIFIECSIQGFFKLYVFCQEIKTDSADIGQIRRNKKYPQSHPQGFLWLMFIILVGFYIYI